MKEYRLSKHAQEVITERNIKIEWIKATFNEPDKVESDLKNINLEHRLKAIIQNEGRVLRVVCNKSIKPEIVVTAFFDRRLKGKVL